MRLIRVERLRAALQWKGMSQSELAENLKVNPSYISDLLKPGSTKSFGEKAARKIEDALQLDTGWLDEAPPPLDATGLLAPEILERIAALSPEQRAGLEGVIRAHLATLSGAPGNGARAA